MCIRDSNNTPLIQSARKVNDGKPEFIIEKTLVAASQKGARTVACLGLAYKADIDDFRESPAVYITANLRERLDGEVLVVEPNLKKLPDTLSNTNGITLCSLEESLKKSEVIVLLVDHQEFRELDPVQLKNKLIIDSRGIWC